MKIVVYTDGAARGNPGPAGAGGLLLDPEGAVLGEVSAYLGEMTNNQAEYRALLLTLHRAHELGATEIHIFADSELMVKQLNGVYRVKNADLKPLFQETVQQLQKFKQYTIQHLFREKNKRADQLANRAIDEHVL
ncbi:MAG: hypothetical protein A3I05_07895 [Deltaproteobacteria bacterium RIFCSPLOWO2_02_FULL_44_10]|nr:MAG: hypothetical protein A3C46_01745 [Deltaproteobacteria bacterium RIFCSPHIGHO2_02_FULL_44_16]OGQ45607.1 MAG: hypothetical protein A3I05_07895 [Deltaproteobacteria bacterium RIFCSPLOWO2_02_FULL_44_10]